MPDVVVIGGASLNTIVLLDELPSPRPHTVTARTHRRVLGGTSAGKSLHLARRGRSTLCVTVVGRDDDAATILAALARDHLDVVALGADGPSEHHLNLMTDRGERVSIYLDHAPAATPSPSERHRIRGALRDAHAIALDLSDIGRAFAADAASSRAPVWVDLHDYDGRNPYHDPFLAVADVLMMNADGMADPVPFLRSRVAAGAHAAVCTLGAEGAIGIAGDGGVVTVPAQPAIIVDTNGAGDAFAAGMIDEVLTTGAAGPLTADELRRAMTAGAAQAVQALGTEGLAPGL